MKGPEPTEEPKGHSTCAGLVLVLAVLGLMAWQLFGRCGPLGMKITTALLALLFGGLAGKCVSLALASRRVRHEPSRRYYRVTSWCFAVGCCCLALGTLTRYAAFAYFPGRVLVVVAGLLEASGFVFVYYAATRTAPSGLTEMPDAEDGA